MGLMAAGNTEGLRLGKMKSANTAAALARHAEELEKVLGRQARQEKTGIGTPSTAHSSHSGMSTPRPTFVAVRSGMPISASRQVPKVQRLDLGSTYREQTMEKNNKNHAAVSEIKKHQAFNVAALQRAGNNAMLRKHQVEFAKASKLFVRRQHEQIVRDLQREQQMRASQDAINNAGLRTAANVQLEAMKRNFLARHLQR